MYYVYILRCAGNTLYTGIAADIGRRMAEHFGQTEKCAKYTKSHKAEKLEALWQTENRSLASKLEYRIKQLTKAQKLRLIGDNSYLSQIIGEESENYIRKNRLPD
ncbi:MAG: GIY-YIG nuclease family protein [Ruminococcus sp.]|nr:GIY-YIG nuclease family protein [Ruminococcus sp.]